MYRGWIPSSRGRLSFSRFGLCQEPFRAVNANVGDGRSRCIVCYQRRSSLGGVNPFVVRASEREQRSRHLWFVCVARTRGSLNGANGAIAGAVYIIPSKALWRTSIENEVRAAQDWLRSYVLESEDTDLASAFQVAFPDLEGAIEAQAITTAQFTAQRDGVVEIRFEDGDATKRSRYSFDASQPEFRLADMIYHFLKDIGHRHQHHDATDERLLGIHRADDGDSDWRWQTIKTLQRRILEAKNGNTVEGCLKAIGILQYARTFIHLSRDQIEMQDPSNLDYAALESSVMARKELLEWCEQRRRHWGMTSALWVCVIFLGLIAFGIVFTVDGHNPTAAALLAYGDAAGPTISRDIFSFAVLVVAGLTFAISWPRLWRWQPFSKLIADAIRLLSAFHHVTAALTALAIGFLILMIAIIAWFQI